MDQSNGNSILSNGVVKNQQPPPIPHITENIISMADIVRTLSAHALISLNNHIKNIPQQTTIPDTQKKKELLNLLIQIRRDFTKLYVLNKWSVNAKDFTKLIDLLSFLRSQQNIFNGLIYGVRSLNQFVLTAKLPNPDLVTALEVLIYGRPQLPSYHLIEVNKLNPTIVLKTLKDLNVIISTRLALIDDILLPAKFRKYVVKDGRVTFSVEREFEVVLSIASSNIENTDQDDTEGNISPFFLLDFKFLFGAKDNVISELISTSLPEDIFRVLEKTSNRLLSHNLQRNTPSIGYQLRSLYDFLHRYSVVFKLYLLDLQLHEMVKTVWRNNLSFYYDSAKFFIRIFYWVDKNKKVGISNKKFRTSFIEIGVNREYELCFRWFKDGLVIPDNVHGIKFNDEVDLSIEWLLQQITSKHSEISIKEIYNNLMTLSSQNINAASKPAQIINSTEKDSICTLLTPTQIKIDLTTQKSIVIAIDNKSGRYYLHNPSPNMAKFILSLNQETMTVDSIIYSILKLRLEVIKLEINNMLVIANWIWNVDINLSSQELHKLNSIVSPSSASSTSHQFFRRKFWPSGWFLINHINGLTFELCWYVAKIRSKNGSWVIEWFERIKFQNDNSECQKENAIDNALLLNFKKLAKLDNLSENLIINHLIIEELKERKIKIINNSQKLTEVFDKKKLSVYNMNFGKDNIIIIKNENLLPSSMISNSLFLKLRLKNNELKLTLLGKFLSDSSINDFNDPMIQIKEKYFFEITDMIKISDKNENEKNLLQNLSTKVEKFSIILVQLKILLDLNVKIIKNSLEFITFQYGSDDLNQIVTLKFIKNPEKPHYSAIQPISTSIVDTPRSVPPSYDFGEQSDNSHTIELKLEDSNPHKFLENELTHILESRGISSLVIALQRTLHLVQAFTKIEEINRDVLKSARNIIKINQLDFQKITFQLNCIDISDFEFIYYATNLRQVGKLEQPHRERISMKVVLRRKGSDKLMYHIQYNEALEKLNFMQSLLENRNNFSGLIVPLNNSIACDIQSVYMLITDIHQKILNHFLD